MIFRELNNKLYEITLPAGVTEDEFLEKQKYGSVKFIKVNPENLPAVPNDEQRHFSKIFYKLNNENIVIDYKRTVEQWLKDKYKGIEDFIYSRYPQGKQNSDLADKIYYETILKVDGIENLEADIATRVRNFFAGSSFDKVVEDVNEENKHAYSQLVKVGIRTTWVQLCKKELKTAIAENREPKYPEYTL